MMPQISKEEYEILDRWGRKRFGELWDRFSKRQKHSWLMISSISNIVKVDATLRLGFTSRHQNERKKILDSLCISLF